MTALRSCGRLGSAWALRVAFAAAGPVAFSACSGSPSEAETPVGTSETGTGSDSSSEVSAVASSFTTAALPSTGVVPTTGEGDSEGEGDPTAASPEPGLRYASYVVPEDVEVMPEFSQLEPEAEGVAPDLDATLGPSEDYYALVFEGALDVPRAGDYTFWLASDDGSKLFLFDEPFIDNDGLHTADEAAVGTASLEPGLVPLRVEFFEAAGDAVLTIEWEGPDLERQPLPAERLFHTDA